MAEVDSLSVAVQAGPALHCSTNLVKAFVASVFLSLERK
jgi:hypothetical protein